MSVGQSFKEKLYPLYCLITGRGGRHLLHKKQMHQLRAGAERCVLEDAKTRPDMFRQNVCPACGDRKMPRREFSNPPGFQFAVCPGDGMVYMDPVPTEKTLDRLYNDPSGSFLWLEDHAPEDVKVAGTNHDDYEAILRMMPGPHHEQKMLDVGCATGSFLVTASQMFAVEGCELNAKTAETARANGFRVTTGGLEDVPGRETFRLITMLQVIEHLPAPEESLREVSRLLQPGGYFYLNTPNIDSASFSYLSERHIHVSSFGHVSLFTKAALERLAKRCGFEVVGHEYCGGGDLALHDFLTLAFCQNSFHHRMACYQPRLFYGCKVVDQLTGGLLTRSLTPRGNESYQRALFRKVEE